VARAAGGLLLAILAADTIQSGLQHRGNPSLAVFLKEET
jgi:hypothetical protein